MERKEVVVETPRVMVMRPIRRVGALLEGWCAHCNRQVVMICLEEAALAGISLQVICRKAQAGELHFTATADGFSYICLNSLLE